jgi:hypothetical protein
VKIALEHFILPMSKLQNKSKFLQSFMKKPRAERIEGYGLLFISESYHIGSMGEVKNSYKILVGNGKGRKVLDIKV